MNTSVSETVVVLGASRHPHRYSHVAVGELLDAGYPVVAVGSQPGVIGNCEIITHLDPGLQAHTATLYLRPELQASYHSWLLSGAVKRVIFNPGSENVQLKELLEAAGVEVVFNCTLVMLSRGVF